GLVHQGDAPGSTFGICARNDVLGRMTGFADEGDPSRARPAPTPDRLDDAARALFHRRRLAADAYVRARRRARALGLEDLAVVRACAQAFRRVARRLMR